MLIHEPSFTNILAVMRPKTTRADLPSCHTVSNRLQNDFIDLMKSFRADIASAPGTISPNWDLWTATHTKTHYIGLVGQWISILSGDWKLRTEVLAFHKVVGDHSGRNLGRLVIKLLDRAGVTSKTPEKNKVSCRFLDDNHALTLARSARAHDGGQRHKQRHNGGRSGASTREARRAGLGRQVAPSRVRLNVIFIFLGVRLLTMYIQVYLAHCPARHRRVHGRSHQNRHHRIEGSHMELRPTGPIEPRQSGPSRRHRNRAHARHQSKHFSAPIHVVADSRCQIQTSGQRVEAFHALQHEMNINTPLVIPLHGNTRWGSAHGMCDRAYTLRHVSQALSRSLFPSSGLIICAGRERLYRNRRSSIRPHHNDPQERPYRQEDSVDRIPSRQVGLGTAASLRRDPHREFSC